MMVAESASAGGLTENPRDPLKNMGLLIKNVV
jgi:hypothetical protein